MQSFSLGAGLAALAFWGFIASVVVAGPGFNSTLRLTGFTTSIVNAPFDSVKLLKSLKFLSS